MDICTAIAAAATVAGTAASVAGAQEAQNNADKATRAELARQSEYQRKAQATFASSLQNRGPQDATQAFDIGATQRQAQYGQERQVPLTTGQATPMQGGGQRLLSSQATRQQDALGDAQRARLAGYTDWDLQNAIRNLRANQELATIGSLSAGSSGVLPIELNAAAHSGDTLQGIGSLLGTAGNFANAYGVARRNPNTPSFY